MEKIKKENRVWITKDIWRAKTSEERLRENKIDIGTANLFIALNENKTNE